MRCRYTSWLVIFTLSIFANRGTANQYNYVDLWRAQAQAGIPSPFATVDHFWSMVKDGMLPMLGPVATDVTDEFGNVTSFSFASSEGDYGLAYKSPPNSGNETIHRLAMNGNAVVDGIWIRQLRISTVNCSKFGTLSQVRTCCHHEYNIILLLCLFFVAAIDALFLCLGL